MGKMAFVTDGGENFGKWNDPVSQELYFGSTRKILDKIKVPDSVADYGGGNGLLKRFIPHALSIDLDRSKKPDVVGDILIHSDKYDMVVIRYVLHYLSDLEVIKLFETVNAKNVLVQQFVNNDLKSKYGNSINEQKYFRTREQLLALLPDCKVIHEQEIKITAEFYRNRLNNKNGYNHQETILGLWI